MDFPITPIDWRSHFPALAEIPEPPAQIYVCGALPPREHRLLAVVGSRNYTNYGSLVVDRLVGGLAGHPISIVSGLALGIDALAHESALRAGLHTIAVPGSGLDERVLYPAKNRGLARRILDAGGCLLSEFPSDFEATQWSFPRRNRIMAGLSEAVLLIEAGEKSGTLITARLAADYNRELLVVPGNIFSENSRGVHQFLKLGATPVTSPEDILEVLGLDAEEGVARTLTTLGEREELVMKVLTEPRDHDTIIRLLPFPPNETIVLLSQMELDGHIREEGGIFYRTH